MKRGTPKFTGATAIQDDPSSITLQTRPSASQFSEGDESPRKLGRHSSRIMSALLSLTRSASGSYRERSSRDSTTSLLQSPQRVGDRKALKKRFSLSALRTSFTPGQTMVHRRPISRLSIHSFSKTLQDHASASVFEIQLQEASNLNSNSNTTTSGPSSGPTSGANTTAKTSLDSKVSKSSTKTNSGDKQSKQISSVIRRVKEPEAESKDYTLEPIAETALDPWVPTIKTVEKAAAAKIYLETYFSNLLSKPSPRLMRLQYLEAQLYHSNVTPQEKAVRRRMLYQMESNNLRDTRVLKSRSFGPTFLGLPSKLANKYEVLKILGKGSFGVVRLVREKGSEDSNSTTVRRPVYAMKVIRKSAMLRTNQEGHLRAERDFLVLSDGSKWIVPLVASFQDPANLYLVMEYMPGGDFLGLLIRENILSEPMAKFYIAEMILCIEEAHALRCIHRDIKPDNFLVSASGHLKISDFGLAFDGHWSHDTSYYHSHRYSLVHKLGLSVEGDAQDRSEGFGATMKWARNVAQGMDKHERKDAANISSGARCEPLLNWRNRCGNRTAARSVVGTSQYMAPEWSVGVILYECVYGRTPFLSEKGGRQETKRNIVNHRQTFAFPTRPLVSNRCMDIMSRLICEKESRLCSKRYQTNDQLRTSSSTSHAARHRHQDFMGRFVYPHDGEDIKTHKWLREIPWNRLHLVPPPFEPQISSLEDAHYFEEEEPISDWSESQPGTETEIENESSTALPSYTSQVDGMVVDPNPLAMIAPGVPAMSVVPPVRPSLAARMSPQKMADMHAILATYPKPVRKVMSQYVNVPYDSMRLKRIHREIEHMSPDGKGVEALKEFVRNYGRKEKKRPRDRLLRDRQTKGTVLEIRKQSAFLGYTWTRMKGRELSRGMLGPIATESCGLEPVSVKANEGCAVVAAPLARCDKTGLGNHAGPCPYK
ncbi:kinase-like domain-containing protein [Truncatella angustata]|uniref:non-specific serine/threonine protein kinase n=1 Tax=Truncatella angustata TaxID=152316 RepID=A0A9P8UY26_9PEZI|nr:kinase-like domain-containing protein [Truncatella angustata]KAH6660044.1 kinase-like domain-containing protein [Truncatella angustata]